MVKVYPVTLYSDMQRFYIKCSRTVGEDVLVRKPLSSTNVTQCWTILWRLLPPGESGYSQCCLGKRGFSSFWCGFNGFGLCVRLNVNYVLLWGVAYCVKVLSATVTRSRMSVGGVCGALCVVWHCSNKGYAVVRWMRRGITLRPDSVLLGRSYNMLINVLDLSLIYC